MNTFDHRAAPQAIESEQSILGALLSNNNAFDSIADLINASDFYRDDHRRIYRHLARLISAGQPADVITVAESLDDANESESTGGLAYLGDLVANTPSASNVRRYAEIVREKSMLRTLQEAALTLHDACANPSGRTVEELIAAAESSLLAAADRSEGDPKPLLDVLQEAIEYVDERCQRGGQYAGLTTGFDDFDRLTGGLEPGQLVIVAARPSVGKTIFGSNVADSVAQRGSSALFFTLEMSAREIGSRLLSARSQVSVHDMRTGTNDKAHWERMTAQLSRAGKHRLFVDDKAAIGVGYVRAKARRIKRKHGLDLIVIDYLGLMQGHGDNRTQEIGSISRGLKALAKELRVPILALAQLNRGVESRTDKRPMMSDLRDSGEIEQDADIVAMLHREEIYSDAPEWKSIAELLVRKNRNGPLGDVALLYQPEQMRFASLAGPSPRQAGTVANLSRQDAYRHERRTRGFPDN